MFTIDVNKFRKQLGSLESTSMDRYNPWDVWERRKDPECEITTDEVRRMWGISQELLSMDNAVDVANVALKDILDSFQMIPVVAEVSKEIHMDSIYGIGNLIEDNLSKKQSLRTRRRRVF